MKTPAAGVFIAAIVVSLATRAPSAPGQIPVSATPAASFAVSPRGNDSDLGTLDRPFRTIDRARDAVRAINHDMTGDIVVYLRGGIYTLDHTVTFDQRDSGTNGHRVIYTNYRSETPLVSGGRTITGWQRDGASGRWKANVGAGLHTRQLYIRGVRAIRARSSGNLAGTVKTESGWTTTDPSIRSWRNLDDVDVVSNTLWKQFHCAIQAVNAIGGGTDIVVRDSCWTASGGRSPDPAGDVSIMIPAWFENAFELLDAPGEWYYNRVSGWIYYLPRPAEDLTTATVVLPLVERLLQGTGTSADPLHDIAFQGITFSYGTWTSLRTDDSLNEQGTIVRLSGISPETWHMPLANISFAFVRRLEVSRNTFSHLGGAGLYLGIGSQNNSVVGNLFSDISSDGILLGDATPPRSTDPALVVSGNIISNNYIANVGAEYQSGAGVFINYARDTTVTHNELSDLPHNGIAIVGSADANRQNSVRYNYVHDVMKALLDGGNIFSHGTTEGNVYADNLLTGTNGNSYGAIYLDDYSSHIEVYNNIIFNAVVPMKLKVGSAHVNVHDNWWNAIEPIDFTPSSWDDPAHANTPSSAEMLTVNHERLAGLDRAPVAIVSNAGLEADFRHIKSDATPPSVPGAPSATGVSTGLISLAWNASTDDVGVVGYKILRSGAEVAVSFVPSYLDTGLSSATVYSYNVAAYDAAGNQSALSRQVSARTMDTFAVDLSAPLEAVHAGEAVHVKWAATGQPLNNDWIGLFAPGTTNGEAKEWMFLTCARTRARTPPPIDGACSFALPGQLSPGTYEFRYLINNGVVSVARSRSFAVLSALPSGGTQPAP